MKNDRDDGLSIIVPVYNEASSIEDAIRDIRAATDNCGYPCEIIVVNDGSTDSTADVLSTIGGIIAISHPENRGYGASLKTGIPRAGHEIICITDADGTYPADMIPEIYRYMDENDMVVGARNGESVTEPWHLKLGKFFIFGFASLVTGRRIVDLNSGLRMFRKEDILPFFSLMPDGFSFTSTTTISYYFTGLKTRYVSVNYYRRRGKSKMKPVSDGYKIIRQIVRTAYHFNPVKIYAMAAIVILVILAIIMALYMFISNGAGMTMLSLLAYICAVICPGLIYPG